VVDEAPGADHAPRALWQEAAHHRVPPEGNVVPR